MKVDRAWLKAHAKINLRHEPEVNANWQKEFEGSPDVLRWIESEQAAGNTWAWCSVQVHVMYGGFQVNEYLGSCSYQNEAEFRGDGYFNDMVESCVDEIADSIEALGSEHALWEHEKRTCILCLAD